MEELVSSLFNYGVLGLWTVTLLYSKQRLEVRYQEQLDKLDERVMLISQKIELLNDKLDRSLGILEERVKRTQFSTETLQDIQKLLK